MAVDDTRQRRLWLVREGPTERERPAEDDGGAVGAASASIEVDPTDEQVDPDDELYLLGERCAETYMRADALHYEAMVLLAEYDGRGGWRDTCFAGTAEWLAWRIGIRPEATRRLFPSKRRADAIGLLAERAPAAGFGDGPVSGSRAERYQVVLHVEEAGLRDPAVEEAASQVAMQPAHVSAETSEARSVISRPLSERASLRGGALGASGAPCGFRTPPRRPKGPLAFVPSVPRG